MANATKKLIEEEEKSEEIRFIGIDSNNDVERLDVPRQRQIQLDRPDDDDLEDAKESRAYLSTDADMGSRGGATKDRPVGRYYLDSGDNFSNLIRRLRNRIEEFEEDEGPFDSMDIWVMNALGGGTGSGMMPLFVAALDQIILSSFNGISFNIRGVGSLPRLDELEDDFTTIDADKRHPVNAYAALSELRPFFDKQEYLSETPKIEVKENPREMRKDEIPVEGNEFDRYFLLGFNEGETGNNYRRMMNDIAARLILYYYTADEIENFPDVPGEHDDILMSVDGARLEFPLVDVVEYVEKIREERELGSILGDLNDQVESYERDKKYLSSVLTVEPGKIPEYDDDVNAAPSADAEYVAPSLVRRCRKWANNRDSDVFTATNYKDEVEKFAEGVFNGDNHEYLRDRFRSERIDVETVDKHSGEQIEEADARVLSERIESFDGAVVVEYILYRQLLDWLKREIRTHEFDSTLEEKWEYYKEEFRKDYSDEYDTIKNEDAETRWTRGLDEYFDLKTSDIQDEINDRILITGSLEDKKEEIESDWSRLEELYSEWDELRDFKRDLKSTIKQIQGDIRDRRADFEDAVDSLKEEIDEVENKIEISQDRREELAGELTDFTARRYTTLQLTSKGVGVLSEDTVTDLVGLEEFSSEIRNLDEPTIPKALELFVDTTNLEENLEDVLRLMGEPIEDLDLDDISTEYFDVDHLRDTDDDPYRLLVPILNDANMGEGTGFDLSDTIDRIGHMTFDDITEEYGPMRNKHTIQLLGIYSNLDLAKTSEFGKMQEHFLDEDKSISGYILGRGGNLDDHLHFAYPELVGDRQLETHDGLPADR